MIARIRGVLIEGDSNSVMFDVNGLCYRIYVSPKYLKALNETDFGQSREIVIYHYLQTDPSRSIPVLIGFETELEKDFFEQFITVSGIGPKAALRAFSVPIAKIVQAIDVSDKAFLKTLPGVGEQRAREIIAKLQGRVGRFGLIQESGVVEKEDRNSHLLSEAMMVMEQLQYRQDEAKKMIELALDKNPKVDSVEELLNEVYRQKSLSA